jgi:Kef-type K+ transport system membrane component KefB
MIKPGPTHRKIVYLIFSLLWISGAVYLTDRYLLGDLFSLFAARSPLQSQVIKIHALLGLIFLFIFGSLYTHFDKAWPLKRKRLSGILLSSSVILLCLSSWMLYYLTSDLNRTISIGLHSILGILAPLLIILHIFSEKK